MQQADILETAMLLSLLSGKIFLYQCLLQKSSFRNVTEHFWHMCDVPTFNLLSVVLFSFD